MSTHMMKDKEITLVTALTARYTLAELITAYRQGQMITCYFYPDGKSGGKRRWCGIPEQDQITTARTLLSVAMGRSGAERMRVTGAEQHAAPDPRSPLGAIDGEYERILTYKWTTDFFTRSPIPPNSYAWRCLHTGKISIAHPFHKHATSA